MSEGDQFVETFRRLSLRGSRAAAAEAARAQGSSAERVRRLSAPIVNPFDRPSQGSHPEPSPAKSDVSMTDVSEDLGVIMNAPALPRPPRYKGSSMQERREFNRAYNTYFSALSAFQTPHNRPFVQPVGSCIEQGTKEIIARFTFAKHWRDVTEAEWVEYFLEAQKTSFEDYAALDIAMKKLAMDTKLAEAESRVNRLQANMYKILEEHNMVDVMFDREQKKLVKYLVAALAPQSFKEEIQRRVNQEQNKAYKSNVIEFSRWLTDLLSTFMMWEKSLLPRSEPATSAARSAPTGRHNKATAGGPKGAAASGGPSTSKSPSPSGDTDTAAPKRFRWPCLKCKSHDHLVRNCPHAEPGDAQRLVAEFRASRASPRPSPESTSTPAEKPAPSSGSMKRLAAPVTSPPPAVEDSLNGDRGTVDATVYGLTVRASLLDSGADVSSVSRGFIHALHEQGIFVPIISHDKPRTFDPFGPGVVKMFRLARFEKVVLHTSAGPLVLRNLECWVNEADSTQALTVGRSVMSALGYSTDGLLVSALERQTEYVLPSGNAVVETPLSKAQQLREVACFDVQDRDDTSDVSRDERFESRVLLPDSGTLDENERGVTQKLLAAIQDARGRGLHGAALDKLEKSLEDHNAEFCVVFGRHPPVKVEPLRVKLNKDFTPVRLSARRYAPMQQAFMDAHVAELEELGLVYRNYTSHWACAPRIVPKPPPSNFRMCIDSRPVNAQTIPMQWPMPQLDVVISHVAGAKVFFICDWFRGYWQLPLHPESQEIFTFITHRGMYTPTRVPMGARDAVAYCQSVVEQIFGDLLYNGVLVWLDDILGYAESEDELMDLLEQVLQRCHQYGLKLHPGKCKFFLKEVTWCGKVISARGVTHSPERVQGLVDMSSPSTAAELQQFVCAANWMRSSIPDFARVTSPLYAILEKAMQSSGARSKKQLQKVALSSLGWGPVEEQSLVDVKSKLLKMVPLAHPNPEWEVALVTDASQDHWGAVVVQFPPDDDSKPLSEQQNQPLAFLSGHFRGASHRWPTIEKEAFAIVESCKRLEYLLLRSRGFRLYTDHRNLVYIFNPYAIDGTMQRYQADKLQRWSMALSSFTYEIEHIRGEDNVWGDLLSRWGASSTSEITARMHRLAIIDQVSPLLDGAFEWPSYDEILREQTNALRKSVVSAIRYDAERKLFVNQEGRVWIPSHSIDLQQRLCVIAHAGASGHRGVEASLKPLADMFVWSTISVDMASFVSSCLQCLTTRGSKVPRPFGETLRATKPNELLHFDFLSMPRSVAGTAYVLVLKDNLSGFVELIECERATSDAAYHGLLDWSKRFGVVHQWISDQGSHFVGELIEKFRVLLGAQHHFVTAYSPWANGSVEVVNRLLLRSLRPLLSEHKLQINQWPQILPLVQATLNSMGSDRLGGVAPVTAFTGLSGSSQLSAILTTSSAEEASIEWVHSEQQKHLQAVRIELDKLHQQVSAISAKKNAQARVRQKNKQGVKMAHFSVGDFVLAASAVKGGSKLALKWRGPKRVVRSLNDYTFEVQDLVAPYAVSVRHASRLKFYRDSSRELTEDLVAHVLHGEGGHLVDKFLDCRKNSTSRQWEILVQWIGLDPEEASWEPASVMLEDVPTLVSTFVDSSDVGSKAREMWSAITPESPVSRPPQRRRQAVSSRRKGGK